MTHTDLLSIAAATVCAMRDDDLYPGVVDGTPQTITIDWFTGAGNPPQARGSVLIAGPAVTL